MSTATDTSELTEYEFSLEIPCESLGHNAAAGSRDGAGRRVISHRGGGAVWLFTAQCPECAKSYRLLVCDGRRRAETGQKALTRCDCGYAAPRGEFGVRYVPIPECAA